MFERLIRKEIVSKDAEASRFGVDKKTIQRDIDEIRSYLSNFENDQGFSRIKYCKKNKGYMLVGNSETWFANEEILAIARVLLESRAFSKAELTELINKLVLQCKPTEAKKIKEIIRNEQHHYLPVQHGKPLLQTIWGLSQAVREQKLIKICYCSLDQGVVERLIEPQSVIFAEYYFYLIGKIHKQKYKSIIPYRLDRIIRYELTEKRFSVSYAQRFEEGEFRKRIQFMQPGDKLTITLKYWGLSEEAILDRLPTAEVVRREGKETYIKAEVFGCGIKMWLLSQAQYLEVISPVELRDEIKATIAEMLNIYNK